MGINPTPTNHRSFTFDGKSTREFGVYTTGKDVFNSPERAVEMISIPGRDGEYALDQGHFNNIEVTYRAGIVSDSTTDFAEAISNFRNWLASRKGYCRLTDEYNTEEYRMAVFKNAIALEHEGLLTGEFDVTFDCKPQRFLAIGEEFVEIGAWGNTETAEGEVVTIEASSDTAVKSLVAEIVPIQSGSGTPSPSNIRTISGISSVSTYRGGSNPLGASSASTQTLNGVTFTSLGNGAYTISGVSTASTDFSVSVPSFTIPPSSTHTVYFNNTQASSSVSVRFMNGSTLVDSWGMTPINRVNSAYGTMGNKVCDGFVIRVASGQSVDMTIAPIFVSNDETSTYTTPLPQTVYGGTLDVVSGLLTVNRAIITYNGTETWNSANSGMRLERILTGVKVPPNNSTTVGLVCNEFSETTAGGTWDGTIGVAIDTRGYISVCKTGQKDMTQASFQSFLSSNPMQVVYPLATPQTYSVSPQQIELLLGENNIFADSGNVTVEYGHNPTILTNPTWFPSRPLVALEGYGEINLGKHKIEVDNVPIGNVTLASGMSFYLENRTQTFSLDADKYNVGDIITVAVNQIGFDYSISTNTSAHAHSTTATDSMSGVTSTVKADTSFWGTACLFYGTTKPSSITFTAGTSANFVNVVSGRLTIQKENLALRNILYTLTETVSYDATQNTISFSLASTTSYDAAEVTSADLRNRFTPSKIDGINVFSTISAVDGTVYIDCDVGECWNVNGDVILPLNNVISLGSDLPTLPSGDTEVTYDNTITKLEVQPNWWKV